MDSDVGCIIVCLLVCAAVGGGITIAFYFTCAHPSFCYKTETHQQLLSEILPKLFQAELVIYDIKLRVKIGTIQFKWDRTNDEFWYQETQFDTDSPSNMRTDVTVTVERNIGVVSYFIGSKRISTCLRDVKDVPSYAMIKLSEKAVSVSKNLSKIIEPECIDRLWYSKKCQNYVLFCEKNSSLVYIREGNIKFEVVGWTLSLSRTIKAPIHHKKCNITVKLQNQLEVVKDKTYFPETKQETRHKKTCLFIHGAGQEVNVNDYIVRMSFEAYWGRAEEHVKGKCNISYFMNFDSVIRGWDNSYLQESFCKFAGGINSTITNTILFAHSMGNLIVAAALNSNLCSFDRTTSEWYAIQAPWKGSLSIGSLANFCNVAVNPLDVFKDFAKFCLQGDIAPAFKTLQSNYTSPSGVTFENLIEIAKKYVNGALCGDSDWGMGNSWKYDAIMQYISYYSDIKIPSDGVISFQSCDAWGAFNDNYRSKFYRGKINHMEGTCRFGDAKLCPIWYDKDKAKPCSWIKHL